MMCGSRTDLGETWSTFGEGLAYDEGGETLEAVWSLAVSNGSLYAGVKPAGLFRSDDGGQSWTHIAGPAKTSDAAGLAGRRRRADPAFAGARSRRCDKHVGRHLGRRRVPQLADGGKTWEARNRGTRADFMPGGPALSRSSANACIAWCARRASRTGSISRTIAACTEATTAARRWESIEAGLPSSFGFPAAVHPRDPDTLYLVPLNGDTAGRYPPDARRRCGGRATAAIPGRSFARTAAAAYFAVLRQAMATDRLDPAGVYFGTNTGTLFASRDEGDSWSPIAQHLPTILSVETHVVDS